MRNAFSDLVLEGDELIARSNSDFEAFMAIEPIFTQLVSGREFLHALHGLLEENLAGKREVTPDISSGQFMVLHGSRIASWAILNHGRRNRHLYLAPAHSMSASIAAAPVAIHRFDAPADLDLSVLREDVQLVDRGQAIPEINEIFSKDGRREILDVAPAANRPALTFRVNTMPFDDFEWSFDRSTLRPLQISSMKQVDSNLTTIFDLLAAVRSPRSLEHLERYAIHPTHFVRWKAIQTISAIDKEMALLFVKGAADDRHPHVRAAARATLATQH